ncbi:MAG: ATP-binding protein [Chthoniobacteraceae bacterium]
MAQFTNSDTFSELLNAELPKFAGAVRMLRVAAGEVIFKEGAPGDGMYLMDEGRVEIVLGADDPEPRVLSNVGPGGVFGEMAIIDDKPRSATARAAVDSVLRFIPHGDVLRLFSQSPHLLLALMRDFTIRMRDSNTRHVEELLETGRLSLIGRFAQSVVHDLKNPLNIIGIAADLAGSEQTSAENRTMATDMIRREVSRLSTMINEVLDYTRQTPGSTALSPAGFHDFVRALLDELRPSAADRRVQIVCENPPPEARVILDHRRLVQAFYNLVNNAADFMPEGGTVTLRFALVESGLQIEVEDSGPGIAPEMAERLFQPFATFGKKTGTGLGLSICKRIIEAHKGRIFARSVPGRGAIFAIALPLAE